MELTSWERYMVMLLLMKAERVTEPAGASASMASKSLSSAELMANTSLPTRARSCEEPSCEDWDGMLSGVSKPSSPMYESMPTVRAAAAGAGTAPAPLDSASISKALKPCSLRAAGSARALTSVCTQAERPADTARCSAVSPVGLQVAARVAAPPWSSKCRKASSRPATAANITAVSPLGAVAVTSARARSNTATARAWPNCAAT
mmetsp:Transcript_50575/g.156867  ORF Transcript_50575/g.156867 Transcript_50575/m.156867 type:complete len:205 (+) Transcript_50575:1360-1974(+)